MKKNNLNYLINIIMFILMMAILGIGLLMKYVLITGEERWIKYGSNVDMYLWGMDRHEWGRIHLILGLILIALLILHLVLHWKSILSFFRRNFLNPVLRTSFISLLLIMSSLLLILPFLVKVDLAGLESGHGSRKPSAPDSIQGFYRAISPGNRAQKLHRYSDETEDVDESSVINEIQESPEPPDISKSEDINEHQGAGRNEYMQAESRRHELLSEIEIQGFMTLDEVARKYNVPTDHLKEKLDIPPGTPDNERLGRLRRLYGFTMSDVRQIIYAEYEKIQN